MLPSCRDTCGERYAFPWSALITPDRYAKHRNCQPSIPFAAAIPTRWGEALAFTLYWHIRGILTEVSFMGLILRQRATMLAGMTRWGGSVAPVRSLEVE